MIRLIEPHFRRWSALMIGVIAALLLMFAPVATADPTDVPPYPWLGCPQAVNCVITFPTQHQEAESNPVTQQAGCDPGQVTNPPTSNYQPCVPCRDGSWAPDPSLCPNLPGPQPGDDDNKW